MPDSTPTPPVPPSPPAAPAPPSVDWKAEAERQGREYSDAVNRRVAEKLAQKKRDLDAKADTPKPEAGASPAFEVGDVTVLEQDGRTIVKQGNKVIVNLSKRDFSADEATITDKDGRTIVRQGDKVMVDVPSKDLSRTATVRPNRGPTDNDIAVPIVFIVFLFLFLIVKTIMGPINRRRAANLPAGVAAGPGLSAADSATLQKIHRTLGQMERRVEALETILADPRRTAAFTTVTRPSTTAPSTSHESKV